MRWKSLKANTPSKFEAVNAFKRLVPNCRKVTVVEQQVENPSIHAAHCLAVHTGRKYLSLGIWYWNEATDTAEFHGAAK